ncbi:MAG: hypothetical protein GQ574_28360 [Crocinitomix sp.]|nr:hypothetical protein [Crocinitomix sp.]
MKFVIIFFGFLLVSVQCTEKNKCESIRTGRFVYEDPEMSEYEIERTESTQVETNLETGMEIHCSVIWNSDCEYVLKYERFKNTSVNTESSIGREMTITVLEVNDKVFKCHLKSEYSDEDITFRRL